VVSVSSEAGEPTLAEQDAAAAAQQRGEVMAHPLVQAVLATFPGATIEAVHDRSRPAPEAAVAPAAPIDDAEIIPPPDEAGEEES
jgi:DNA polymerase-3 subunit gamma/tau